MNILSRNPFKYIAFTPFLISILCDGQTSRVYDSANFLPNAQVNTIHQDREGFIWIGSRDGLARFDGTEFTSFRYNPLDKQSLKSNQVNTFFEDCRNTKWVGTSGGLQIYDSDFNVFKDMDSPDFAVGVSCMAEFDSNANQADRIFVGTSGKGLIALNPDTHQPDTTMTLMISSSLQSNNINFLFVDSRGRLWISAQSGGLSVVSASNGRATASIGWDSSLDEIQTSTIVYSMAEDPVTHNIIMCTANDGILVFDAGTEVIRRARSDAASSVNAMVVLYNDLYNDVYGPSFLVGVENGGLKVLKTDTESLEDAMLPNTPFDYSMWKIHCLTKDSQDNLWVGAYQTGIMVIPRQMYGFKSMKLSTRFSSTENSGCITAVLKDEKTGDIWVGADGGGVFNIMDNKVYTSRNSGLTNDSIMALAMDKRGTLWIGTYLDGIFYKTADGVVEKMKEDGRHLPKRIAAMVYDEKRDRLYACTYENEMLLISADSRTVIKRLTRKNLTCSGTLTLDSEDDVLWVGLQDGIVKYDLTLNDFEIIKQGKDYQYGVPLCTYNDGETLWIGTRNGLISYNTEDGSTVQYSEEDGLPGNSIMSIQKDDAGRLWLATTNGLACMDIENEWFSRYYAYDGLQGNEFRQMSSFKCSDGILFFGGNDGLTRVDPMKNLEKSVMPPVHITKLHVMNEPVDYDPGKGHRNIIDKPLAKASSICLPHNKNFFNLTFSALEYTNPSKIRYRVKMERLDKGWVETDQLHRSATYTHLAPGKYEFRIRAFYEDDPDNYSEKNIDVQIKAPWYASPWAWFIYCMAAIVLFIYIRKARKNREMSNLQAMRLNMFTDLTHEIRTPLTLVMSPLKTLRENEDNPDLKDTYDLMYRNSLRINRIVNQFMDVRKLDEGMMKLNFQETELLSFIKDITQCFSALEEQQNISLSVLPANSDQKVWIDQSNFDKIIFNILSNAFKYTPAGGRIKVEILGPEKNNGKLSGSIDEYVTIDIFNSGSHISSKNMKKLFDRFYQNSVKDATLGSGLGLNIAKMLVELHYGIIEVRNVENGVVFSIRIPCGNKHLAKENMAPQSHNCDLYGADEHKVIVDTVPKKRNVRMTRLKKTVVFVDDDKDMLLYVSKELKSLFNVITFDNTGEALPAIRKMKPDAVVTDLVMPDMSGDELCRRLKDDPDTRLIPVIILTAQADDESLKEATDNAADRVLTKPISIGLLSSSIYQTVTAKERIAAGPENSIIYEYGGIRMNSASNKLIDKVMESIRKNMDNPEFSVESLCEEIGISRVHLNRKMKELVGTSPSTLIRSIRLRQAAFLLINNEVGIAEVAYKVGYSSLSHFSNSFHEYFNMSPKEFATKYKGVTDEQILKPIFE